MAGPTILDESKVQLGIERIAGAIFSTNNIEVRLYEGSVTPDHSYTEAMLEAWNSTFGGYAPQLVSAWGTPVLDGAFRAISLGTVVTFTNAGASPSNPQIGWWYRDVANNKAVLVGKFSPAIIILAGQSYSFTPTFTVNGENLTT